MFIEENSSLVILWSPCKFVRTESSPDESELLINPRCPVIVMTKWANNLNLYNDFYLWCRWLIINIDGMAKQGDNGFGSVHLSIYLSVNATTLVSYLIFTGALPFEFLAPPRSNLTLECNCKKLTLIKIWGQFDPKTCSNLTIYIYRKPAFTRLSGSNWPQIFVWGLNSPRIKQIGPVKAITQPVKIQ